jgi:DNA-binding GntR family transcriptional regulator
MSATLKQKAYDYIRHGLINGRLPNGTRLSPAELARELGTSHIPVREAISQLQSEGLVEQVPRLGAFVKVPEERELFELVDVRQALECYAVARAAKRIRDDQIVEIQRYCDQLKDLVELAESGKIRRTEEYAAKWAAADIALHLVLLRAADNQRLMKMITDARMLGRMFAYSYDAERPLKEMVAEYRENYRVHRELVDAVARRDPVAAKRAMNQHMRRGRENLRTLFKLIKIRSAEAALAQETPAIRSRAKAKA